MPLSPPYSNSEHCEGLGLSHLYILLCLAALGGCLLVGGGEWLRQTGLLERLIKAEDKQLPPLLNLELSTQNLHLLFPGIPEWSPVLTSTSEDCL